VLINGYPLALTKAYEFSEVTRNMKVSYEGTMEVTGGEFVPTPTHCLEKGVWLRGKWDNKQGGCYGSFFCHQQAQISTHICICEICNDPIKPGQTRFANNPSSSKLQVELRVLCNPLELLCDLSVQRRSAKSSSSLATRNSMAPITHVSFLNRCTRFLLQKEVQQQKLF
jgi:hypothetical protein